jgi:uncharacterized membrane protein YkgB
MLTDTWLSFLYPILGTNGASYAIGLFELLSCFLLLAGFMSIYAGLMGALFMIAMGGITLSLLFQMPFLSLSHVFLVKDILMVGGGSVLLKHDVKAYLERSAYV